MPQNLSAQFVCPNPKGLDSNEKRLRWASVVRGIMEDAKACWIVAKKVNSGTYYKEEFGKHIEYTILTTKG